MNLKSTVPSGQAPAKILTLKLYFWKFRKLRKGTEDTNEDQIVMTGDKAEVAHTL